MTKVAKAAILADLDTEGGVNLFTPTLFSMDFFPAVKKRTEHLEALLYKAVESFRSDMQVFISRIPPAVRNVKMKDLMDKYDGDLMACKEALEAQGVEAQVVENCENCKSSKCATLDPPC